MLELKDRKIKMKKINNPEWLKPNEKSYFHKFPLDCHE